MGASGLTAVVVLLLASALLRVPASAGRSLLEGENPNSGGEVKALSSMLSILDQRSRE
jgi:hypothetical protein